jgi:catechol 2,3-dioxygenase-like lactoylglutathione lyase family enzyme
MASGKQRIHHVGIVVDDLEQAVDFLTRVVGLEVSRRAEAPERGGLRAAFLPWGDVQVELLEFSEPETRGRRLGDAAARIEHIAVEVDDADATFERLRGEGVEFTTPAPQAMGETKTFFTVAETTDGVMYQFIGPAQADAR